MNLKRSKSTVLLLSVFVAGLMSLTSCLKDDVEDLQKDMDQLETALGTNEPMSANFSTQHTSGEVITVNTEYLFKAGGSEEYIRDYQDGYYRVYIDRFRDVEWTEGAWIEFWYHPETKTVTSPEAGIYFYDKFTNWISPSFDPENETEGNITCNITVNSFDPTSGNINVSVQASTIAAAQANEYAGKSMTLTLAFKGKLPVFLYND